MRCPYCGQEHPDNYGFCPITGGRIEKESYYHCEFQEEQPKLSPDRIFTHDKHIIRNGMIHCVDCDSTNIQRHYRDALQYTCRDCGLRFGNGGGENYDAKGNKISSYFKFFNIILGVTKKSELDPSNLEEDFLMEYWDTDIMKMYDTGIGIACDDGEKLIKKIILYSEFGEQSSIPKFYRKLGIDFGARMEDNIRKFNELGFKVIPFQESSFHGPAIRVKLPWSNKYQAQLVMDIAYSFPWSDNEGLERIDVFIEE